MFVFLFIYLVTVTILCVYGAHRLSLVWGWWRNRGKKHAAKEIDVWPEVTIQLPLYNEAAVAERVILAVGQLDYPSDRMQIQVLDDSTDITTSVVASAVERLLALGLNAVHIRRANRQGYKAGALAHGLESASGEFVAIFDADFVPQPCFLKRGIPLFSEGVGVVQARWGHLNRDRSLLTRQQALLMDAHFVVEQFVRDRKGLWFNFNGTAGIWRREAIDAAGGWEGDTVTEDLDLSYRAQLAGWRFKFDPSLVVPAELPDSIGAFMGQQRRWARGGIQTAKKLLWRIGQSDAPLKVKMEAFFHLTGNVCYPLLVLLSMLVPLVVRVRSQYGNWGSPWVDLFVFVFATASVWGTYIVAGLIVGTGRRSFTRALGVMCLAIGISVNQSVAVFWGLFGGETEFVRTPKAGESGSMVSSYSRKFGGLELLMAVYYAESIVWAIGVGMWSSLPLLLLFGAGFTQVGTMKLREAISSRISKLPLQLG
jgi:cellulose synthase/poly-beta-1,6-N-acetylglucosamine synthase-like glycosyltransferase